MLAPASFSRRRVDVRRRWLFWIVGVVLFLSPLGLWRSVHSQQPPVWHATGADVGPAHRIALASDKGLTVFYRWSQMGLWRSVDGGRSWAQIGVGLPTNFLGGQLLQALVPGAGSTLYALAGAGDRYGLYRSTDSGATFELLYQPVAFIPTGLAVRPHADGDRILLAGDANVTTSIDGGGAWQTQTLPGPAHALLANQELWVAGTGWLTSIHRWRRHLADHPPTSRHDASLPAGRLHAGTPLSGTRSWPLAQHRLGNNVGASFPTRTWATPCCIGDRPCRLADVVPGRCQRKHLAER